MRRPILPILFSLCLVILILTQGFNLPLYSSGFEDYYDTVQSISGTVKTVQIKKGYTAMTIDLGHENILLRLKNVTDEDYIFDMVGRKVQATGKITKPDGSRNPGCFDYNTYLKARHCYAIIESSRFKFSPMEIKRPISHYISVQKGLFLKASKDMLGEKSFSILSGILFGEKGYMDEELYEQFQTNGIAHVLAVSGLHVGLVYAVIKKLLNRQDYIASIISILLLVIYAALSNFSVSVIRAAAMIVLSIIAFHINRKYDMLSAASLVAIALLIYSPYYLYDSSAQLSFLAAYSIAVLLPWFETRFKIICDKYKKDRLYKIGSVFLPGFVLQIGMAPLMAYHFLNFSPLSIIINPIAIYLASLILPIGLVAFLVYPFKLLLAAACGAAEGICYALNLLSNLSDKILSGFSIPAPPFSLLAIYYLLLFYFFSESRHILLRKGKDLAVSLITISLLAIGSIAPALLGISQSIIPWKYNSYDFVFLDVGQGDSAHVQSQGKNILIDGGGSLYKDIAKDTLKPYLLKSGISKIDLAIVTHLDLDHSKGIADLSNLMKIDTIVFPISLQGEDLSDFQCNKIVFLDTGDEINAADCLIKVMSARGSDSNSGSLAFECINNGTSVLFMADLPIEKELGLKYDDIDVLKVGHHGSKYSTSEKLLNESKPEIAVISCGKNNRYGHPADRVLELLENSGIIIKRTDFEGAICIKNKNILTR